MSNGNGEVLGCCAGCGMDSLALRFDKKGRPYVTCLTCQAKVFARGPGAAERWMALLIALGRNKVAWKPAWDNAYRELLARAGGVVSAASVPVRPVVSVGDGR